VWLGILLLFASLAIGLGGNYMDHGSLRLRTLFIDSYQSLASSLFGTVLTIAFVDAFVRRGERRRRMEELVARIRSGDVDTALDALRELRSSGWLKDGTFRRVHLSNAALPGADLESAVLDGADLARANLASASLFLTRLRGANLSEACLDGANLMLADLREANLYGADLTGADLSGADLRGAVLKDSNVDAGSLAAALTDGRTIMP